MNSIDETVAFFENKFGPVDPNGFIEIVPEWPTVTICRIAPNGNNQCVTLFTIGMSEIPMNVPDSEEALRYQFAELFIQLPADWPLDALSVRDSRYRWPIEYLRELAHIPHRANSWLGGHGGIFQNDSPSDTLGPDNQFTGSFMFAEDRFQRSDGALIQIYRVTPVYWEELELANREGLVRLLQALDKASCPMIVDIHRKNAVTQE